MANKHNSGVALITGAAGFIGSAVADSLLKMGWRVVGVDCLSNYYDIELKKAREDHLFKYTNYRSVHDYIEREGALLEIFEVEKPQVVIHLAAQAGVRYSIENPRVYFNSNLKGTFELLEAARIFPPKHLLLASTSSAYGANTDMPYVETQKADFQVSFYAATKKATENIAHSYSHLFNLSITMFRFFTVYGPWGRPDMAPHLFANAIRLGEEIKVFNHGNMWRDFTYISDIVNSIVLLMEANPAKTNARVADDSLSPVAPFRVVNIGNGEKVWLEDFISELEKALGRDAVRNYLDMQKGDVQSTWAENNLLRRLTNYEPKVNLSEGISKFIEWHKVYYKDTFEGD